MTVNDVINLLNDVENKNKIVVVPSSDDDGINYTIVNNISLNGYNYKDNEIGFDKLTEELINIGYSDNYVMEDGEPAIVIWPKY